MIQALEMKLRGLLKHINPRRSKYSVIVKTISKPNEPEKVWGVDFVRSKHNQKNSDTLSGYRNPFWEYPTSDEGFSSDRNKGYQPQCATP